MTPLHAEKSSQEFGKIVPRAVELIQQWMARGEQEKTPVTRWSSPDEYRKNLDLPLHEEGVDDETMLGLVRTVLDNSVNPWTNRFFAKLYSAPTISSICGDLVLAALNASVHVFSASPVLSLAEETCAKRLCGLFGYGPGADGITMPGGAASNTLAVQTALCHAFGGGYRQGGVWALVQHLHACDRVGAGARPAILTSEESHFSLERAALAAGLGTDAIVRIPADGHGRMRVDALVETLETMSRDPGHPSGVPFFVNATSGTTVLGAFDNLEAVAAACAKYNCWMHVDASWGGPVVFSPRWRDVFLRGAALSDSITINPHKLLSVTHQCSFLLVRDARVLERHAIHAGYLFHEDTDDTDAPLANGCAPADTCANGHSVPRHPPDMAMKTLGCGRRGEALKLYLTWCRYGTAGFAAHVDEGLQKARDVLACICADDTLELGPTADPLFLQICFRPRLADALHTDARASAATRFVHQTLAARRHFAVDFAPEPTRGGDYIR
ncbi:glutamate decarboxylase [Malassezia sp. CBS 17886]|nr:glutamate decarboxylase [Malassezia sp. CBS 17886]